MDNYLNRSGFTEHEATVTHQNVCPQTPRQNNRKQRQPRGNHMEHADWIIGRLLTRRARGAAIRAPEVRIQVLASFGFDVCCRGREPIRSFLGIMTSRFAPPSHVWCARLVLI